jgi:hypothetical protein
MWGACCSERPNRLKSTAKRLNAAYHSSVPGKLNAGHGAGRMPRAVKRYRGARGRLPLSADGLSLLLSRLTGKRPIPDASAIRMTHVALLPMVIP